MIKNLIKNLIKINSIVLAILFTISVGFVNDILAEIPVLNFGDLRGFLVVLENNNGQWVYGFHSIGFYISLVVTISVVYIVFHLFATGFASMILIFIGACIINFFVITASDGALNLPIVTAIQVALGPKVMLILGCIYRFLFLKD